MGTAFLGDGVTPLFIATLEEKMWRPRPPKHQAERRQSMVIAGAVDDYTKRMPIAAPHNSIFPAVTILLGASSSAYTFIRSFHPGSSSSSNSIQRDRCPPTSSLRSCRAEFVDTTYKRSSSKSFLTLKASFRSLSTIFLVFLFVFYVVYPPAFSLLLLLLFSAGTGRYARYARPCHS